MTLIPVKCISPACKLNADNYRKTFQVDSLEAPCPSCGMSGHLLACEYVHLVVRDRFGHMESRIDGHRYKFACSYANEMFKRSHNTPGFPRMYSPNLSVCTCPYCLKELGAVESNGVLLLK